MVAKSSLRMLVLLLASAVADAQGPVLLDTNDVYFRYQPAARTFTATGSNIERHTSSAEIGLCGFTILGNHNSRENPKVEWDLNIAELMSGTTRVAGISAGTFDVVGRERKPRAAIVDISFLIENESQVIAAQIVGSPNADNAIKAILETDPAGKLFKAFSDTKLITINLKYADNTSDTLQIRGWHDWRILGGGKNSYFNQCLRGYTPGAWTR